jgi:hypothetical protein
MSTPLTRFAERERRRQLRRQVRDQIEARQTAASNTQDARSTRHNLTSGVAVSSGRYRGRPEFRLSRRMKNHVDSFNHFRLNKMSFYCAICCCLMYEKDAHYRACETPLHLLPCNAWGRPPIVIRHSSKYIALIQ